ncbi:MAG: fused MFS/spermidine synthase [Acidobacteriota bacterium]
MPKKYILEITVFVSGGLVMVYEIIGSRILAPFIGTSTYIWTSLIGVILGALSLGYWIGGRTADRNPELKILSLVIFLAGGLVSATTLIKDVVLSFIASAQMPLEIKSLIAAAVLFAPASVALGFVTPYAVKLKTVSLADSGKTVGSLFAFSTVGSIVGTFAAGFFLIPFVGSVRTLYIISGGLIVLGLLLVPFTISRTTVAAIIVFILGIAASEFSVAELRAANDLYDIDTQYSRVRVFQTVDPRNNKPITALATDPYFTQSAIYLDSDDRVLEYSRFYSLASYYKPELKKALMIGGAGYTFPQEFLRTHPDATIDVAEIDPGMTEIAKRFFRLKDDPRMKISHADGRVFLNAGEADKYDVVFVDACNSLFSVPYQITTREAVREISRVLKPDGVVLFNLVGSSIRGSASQFLQAEFLTYAHVFPVVDLYKVNLGFPDERVQNLIIAASKDGRQPPPSTGPEIAELLSHRYPEPFSLDAAALTDDLAPVEYYNSIALNFYSRERR